MQNTIKNTEFNPNGVGMNNGNFIGLPYTEETCRIILLPVPWDVTVSFGEGTALAPELVLQASVQLDLYDQDVKDAWKQGIFMQPVSQNWIAKRNLLRPKASKYIQFLENQGVVSADKSMLTVLNEINTASSELNDFVYAESVKFKKMGKLVGIVGGDHSTPFGYMKALAETEKDFGILQIDAHMDLRKNYEGFNHSHASVFRNAFQFNEIKTLVQVGIRDFCEEEMLFAIKNKHRIKVFFDQVLKENDYKGKTWKSQSEEIVSELPEKVYVSFDVDGLDPKLCPATGTPVPGGLSFNKAIFLVKLLVESGRKIIGFDVCETGNQQWDANVAARIIYKLCNFMGKSNEISV